MSLDETRLKVLHEEQERLEAWKMARVAQGLEIGPRAMREYLAEKTGPLGKVVAQALPPPPPPKRSLLDGTRERLIQRWNELKGAEESLSTDEEKNDLYRRLRGLVQLIGWIETNPDAGHAEYATEVRRVQEEG